MGVNPFLLLPPTPSCDSCDTETLARIMTAECGNAIGWTAVVPCSDAFLPQKSGRSGRILPLLFSKIHFYHFFFYHFFLRSIILGGFQLRWERIPVEICGIRLLYNTDLEQKYNRKHLQTEYNSQKFPLRGSLAISPANNRFRFLQSPSCKTHLESPPGLIII